MKTKTKKDCRPTCSECGGTNVEDTAWIAYREDGSAYVVNGEGPLDGSEGSTWCHDCQEHHDLVYPDVGGGLESDAARYRRIGQNEAAREHGPELLEAVIDLLPLAHSHLLEHLARVPADQRGRLGDDGLPVDCLRSGSIERYRKARELVGLLLKGKQ
jgi:hypothetical protein